MLYLIVLRSLSSSLLHSPLQAEEAAISLPLARVVSIDARRYRKHVWRRVYGDDSASPPPPPLALLQYLDLGADPSADDEILLGVIKVGSRFRLRCCPAVQIIFSLPRSPWFTIRALQLIPPISLVASRICSLDPAFILHKCRGMLCNCYIIHRYRVRRRDWI